MKNYRWTDGQTDDGRKNNILREQDNILQEQNNILREQYDMLWEQNNILRDQYNMLWEQNSMLWEQDIILREYTIFFSLMDLISYRREDLVLNE
jgi:hypothetical protein